MFKQIVNVIGCWPDWDCCEKETIQKIDDIFHIKER